MPWLADLHIHSHFSMATSKECNPKNLHRWAGLKGVSLVGTGDFTHPGWRSELRANLDTAEPGFYRLKENINQEVPDQPEIRFVVTGELSTIYKKNGRVRKVHHLIVLPSLEAADKISAKLEELGMNIRSDGRPILGLDSHNLFEIVLEACPEVIYIPAHVWTPHFSVFGSNSGFDDIKECYEDLTQYIFALETGLSSDPAMNWRWSALDRFTLVSNSDAHNPRNLAREANILAAEFSYQGLKEALQNKNNGKFLGTIEFFPEEGKYHLDGHRNCEVCLKPEETLVNKGICPVCGRKVTVGVLHRVALLADRTEGFKPDGAPLYESMVPLKEIIGSAINCGAASKKVEELYFSLLKEFGPELTVLRETDLNEIVKTGGVLVAEGIRRLRTGEVSIQPGYDGAYGVISVLREDDRQALKGQAALFEPAAKSSSKKGPLLKAIVKELANQVEEVLGEDGSTADFGLSQEQTAIIQNETPCLIVTAGPGTGKTRTLVERIAYLINDWGINPTEITGVTFTNKAAAEMRSRLAGILNGDKRVNRINFGTFHSICWRVLNSSPDHSGVKLLDEFESREILEEVLRLNRIPMTAREASLIISLVKNKYLWDDNLAIPPKVAEIYQAYQQNLHIYQRYDFDDILINALELWEENPDWLQPFKKQFNYVLVDEFQDLNLLQYKLVKLWANENKNLMVIGDPNQSIYGFRGAGPQFFEQIRQEIPGVSSLHLTRNYRVPSIIVRAANALINKEYQQSVPEKKEPESKKIIWFEANNERTAAKAVINEIINLMGGSTMLSAHGQKIGKRSSKVESASFSLSDFAILYRTGKQADAIEQVLLQEGLPYRVVGPAATLDSSTVKEFLTFFRYLKDPHDLFLLRANLRQPRWGLRSNDVAEIMEWLKRQTSVEIDRLQQLIDGDLAPELIAKLGQFYGVVQYYKAKTCNKSQEIIEDWMLRMDPVEPGDLEKLKKICENYRNLEELIQFLPLATEADIFRKGQKSTGVETITLSTIHASKGLEFPVVFMVGVEEGLLPYGKEPDPDTVSEEQRLFYVGLTRTQQQLYLVNSQFRYRYGESVPVEASRFLKLLPGDLLEKIIPEQHDRKAKQLELF